MKDENQIKNEVRQSYAAIALKSSEKEKSSCCGPSCCNEENISFADDYAKLDGYVADADLHLGCGIPTEYARMSPGDTVLDLGSGAGNDSFVARRIVGEEGNIIGVDMTYEMIVKARQNNAKMGYENVDFRLGEIENLPVEGSSVDVVLSNCVLNLVPNKSKAFREMYRVLKPGGHFSISDIVIEGDLPEDIKYDITAYAACVSGATSKSEYLAILAEAGFKEITIVKEKKLSVPESLLERLDKKTKNQKPEILSITVYGQK